MLIVFFLDIFPMPSVGFSFSVALLFVSHSFGSAKSVYVEQRNGGGSRPYIFGFIFLVADAYYK